MGCGGGVRFIIPSTGLEPEEVAVAAVPPRMDVDADADALRALARGSRDPAQTRRLPALSAIPAGGSRSDAAASGGVG